jgi:hypothetical protein
MTDIASMNKTSPTESDSTMPSRTPMDSACRMLKCCHHKRLVNAVFRYVHGLPPTHFDYLPRTIFASTALARVQIPIDQRSC